MEVTDENPFERDAAEINGKPLTHDERAAMLEWLMDKKWNEFIMHKAKRSTLYGATDFMIGVGFGSTLLQAYKQQLRKAVDQEIVAFGIQGNREAVLVCKLMRGLIDTVEAPVIPAENDRDLGIHSTENK